MMRRIDMSYSCAPQSPPGRPQTILYEDKMMIIVSLQNFDGSWSQSSELKSVLNITFKELEAKFKGNIWCTAFVVAFLEKNFNKRKSEWEMIYNKAIKWLTSQDREDKSVTQIIEEGNSIIKTI